MTTQNLPVGTRVRSAYHDLALAQNQPWLVVVPTGVVLEGTDPQAWAGTHAFEGVPSKAEVARYVLENPSALVPGEVPVLWSYGRVFWHPIESLVPDVSV